MSTKNYIGKSKLHGRGVFAKKDIRKGEVVFVAKGALINFSVTKKGDSKFGPNWMSIRKDTWLDPQKNNPLTFLNHSCTPNLGVQGKVTFVALRNIKKDEECMVDYSIIELDPLWAMKCLCGALSCRKVIHSVHFLPRKVFNKYMPFIPRYLLKVYNKEHSLYTKNG